MRGRVSFYAFVIPLLALFVIAIDSSHLHGQVFDNFEDGNLTESPTWVTSVASGNSSDFVIDQGVLRSAGPSSSAEIWISTSGQFVTIEDRHIWEFKINYPQPPSNSNRIKVYLSSNEENLSEDPEGYYLLLGESGSDDGIDLYKTSSRDPIIVDPEASVSGGIDLSIRVTRTGDGFWQVYKDAEHNGNYIEVGSNMDTELTLSDHFGMWIKHTSSRNQSFSFDNILIPFQDVIPPMIVRGEFISSTQLRLEFSENLDKNSAENIAHYEVLGQGSPTNVVSNGNMVELTYNSAFSNATAYTIKVTNVEDINGNALVENTADLFYFQPEMSDTKDIIISEIMEDPDPPNDLPLSEFIEIHNRSDKVFNLLNWTVSDQSTTSLLGEAFIFPGEYLILCPDNALSEFSKFGNALALDPFPTLNNGGDIIIIHDPNGQLIDSVQYDRSWYQSTQRQDGGWTLELIDPNNICSDEENWTAAEDPSGGTPGEQNSVFAEKPDLNGPLLMEALALHPDTLWLKFNEPLEIGSIQSASYEISNTIGVVEIIVEQDLRSMAIIPDSPFEPEILYTITINNLRDCPGNAIRQASHSFALIQPADFRDIVINEVLFDPFPNGEDFVEIFNRSNKYIDLRGWKLGNIEEGTASETELTNSTTLASDHLVISPNEYIAFTENKEAVLNFYSYSNPEQVMVVASMPSLPNESGSIALEASDSLIIDAFKYNVNYHFELLSDKEGVSLERISPDEETSNSSNWHSAASTAGFATPGIVNSQSINPMGTPSGITVEPKVIVPDGSGQNDFAVINYNFDRAGLVANVSIYDVQGREVGLLAQNETLSSKGFFTWSGVNFDGLKVRTGYYIIVFEVFNLSGEVNVYKEKVVVGTRF